MAKVQLPELKAGRDTYKVSFDEEIGSTFIHAATGERVFTTNEGGWAYNKHSRIAGRFVRNENKTWYYESLDKSMRMNTKCADRIDAERSVFERLLALGYNE